MKDQLGDCRTGILERHRTSVSWHLFPGFQVREPFSRAKDIVAFAHFIIDKCRGFSRSGLDPIRYEFLAFVANDNFRCLCGGGPSLN